MLDANGKAVTADRSGQFHFAGLAVGTYHVRRVFVSGYTYSTKKIDGALAAGQGATGLPIGTKKA